MILCSWVFFSLGRELGFEHTHQIQGVGCAGWGDRRGNEGRDGCREGVRRRVNEARQGVSRDQGRLGVLSPEDQFIQISASEVQKSKIKETNLIKKNKHKKQRNLGETQGGKSRALTEGLRRRFHRGDIEAGPFRDV